MQKRAKWVWVLASSIQLQVIPSLGVFNFIFPFPFLFLSLLSLSKVGGPNVSEAPPPHITWFEFTGPFLFFVCLFSSLEFTSLVFGQEKREALLLCP